MSRPHADFDDSPEVLFDSELRNSLLLHPDRPVELRRRGRGRRFAVARVGLSVVAVSGLCLLPASTLAEEGATAPTVSSSCPISSVLPDGTPSGVLADGSVCVLPPKIERDPPVPIPEEPAAPKPHDAGAAQPEAAAAGGSAQSEAAADGGSAGAAVGSASVGATASGSAPATAAAKQGSGEVRSPARASRETSGKRSAKRRPAGAKRKRAQTRTQRRAEGSGGARVGRRPRLRSLAATTPAPVSAGALPGTLPGGLAPALYVSDEAVIPRFLIKIYKQAGRRHHIPWPILAAINEIETDFGRNVAVSSAGATGWMQFMPATWRAYGVDADNDGVKDPNNPRDAIFAAARYLRASGARHNMRRAIFAYNHAGWYVDSVLLRAERIAAQQGERDRRLSRLFETSLSKLEREVLADPRITLYDCGRKDIAEHRIDRRVLIALRFLAWSGLHPTVSSLECGHGHYTKSGNVSEHSSGNAVDISAINGTPVFGHQGPGSVTEAAIRELLTLRGAMRPHQIISLMTFDGADNTIAMSDHADHIHLGFRPLAPIKR